MSEAPHGDPRHAHDLVRLPIDDRTRDRVAGRRGAEDDRRELDHASLGDPIEVHRLGQLLRAR